MESLRTDLRQWLIHGEEQETAAFRAVEMFALSVTGQRLARHPDERVRALGTVMTRIGEARGRVMLDGDGAGAVAVRQMSLVGVWLAGGPVPEVDLAQALSELQALMVRIDSRVASAGIRGPGHIRAGVRGD